MSSKISELSIVKAHHSGKVRDIYDLGDTLLIVTSDRISAFDVVFGDQIKNKGKILNQISVNFFKKTSHIIENHFITDEIHLYPKELHDFKEELEDRSMLVTKTRVIPFECIVRGYITGSAWKEYQKTQSIGGEVIELELKESQRFPQPIFTPSTKAADGHDINISYDEMKKRIDLNIAEFVKNKSLELFDYAHNFLKNEDIVLADTKFEFGTIGNKVILIDEIFTPDSSRFWDATQYEIGKSQKSYDKQFVRDYLEQVGWDKNPPAPSLPKEIITNTYKKYYEAYKKIAGPDALLWH